MANRVLLGVEEGMSEPVWLTAAESFLQKVYENLGYDGHEVSVLFCTDAFINNLNKQYRNVDSPTDVLSFENGEEYTDEDGLLWRNDGDIVLSLETLPKNAAYFSVAEDEELRRLLIHGVLHVNGYDHGEEHIEPGVEPQSEMLILQKKILEQLSEINILGKGEPR